MENKNNIAMLDMFHIISHLRLINYLFEIKR